MGGPYEIKGVWYYPTVDYGYDRTGVASWYGEEFEGRLTANGEIFDLNQLTAAHTTLPMPSIVEVTNLENGRALQLRVNDRGPFVDGRLIDVSRRAAQLLGFESRGTTLVRVKILKEESIAAAEEAMRGSGQVVVADAGARTRATAVMAPSVAYSARATVPHASRPAPAIAQTATLHAAPVIAPPVRISPAAPAMAQAATPPTSSQVARPLPPASGGAYAALSRFALIGSAEAAPMPHARPPTPERKIIAGSIPVPERSTSPPRVGAVPVASSGRIYIQAGAFSVRDHAQQVSSRIARLGSVAVTAASVNGVEMYRVRLGPFASAEQADRLLARVVDSGYPGARIVND